MSSNEKQSWDDRIRQALNEPVDDPGPAFTRSVMNRIEQIPDSAFPRVNRPLVVTGAMLTLAVVAILTLRPEPTPQTSAAEQIQLLAREQQALTRELEDLRHLRQSAEPVIYLGGDDSVEFVYALNEPHLANGQGQAATDFRTANRWQKRP